jgi:heptaprenyl diphosphate synthase
MMIESEVAGCLDRRLRRSQIVDLKSYPLGLAVASNLASELERVNVRLRAAAELEHSTLMDINRHLVDAGGKRLRPLLVLAAASAGGARRPFSDLTIEAAACVEFLHLASLCHDDVLDTAATRRGVPSAGRLWGNHRAILGGDLLLTAAFTAAARLGVDVVRRLNSTLIALCIGQIDESSTQFDHHRSTEQYRASVEGKTASLLATSCWLGATCAGAGPAATAALHAFGASVGHAFQLIDDLLDLVADDQTIGKPSDSDLRQGVYTLPVLFAMESDPSLAMLLNPGADADTVDEVRARIAATDAYDRCLTHVSGYIDKARQQLAEPTLDPDGARLLNSIVHEATALSARIGTTSDTVRGRRSDPSLQKVTT